MNKSDGVFWVMAVGAMIPWGMLLHSWWALGAQAACLIVMVIIVLRGNIKIKMG